MDKNKYAMEKQYHNTSKIQSSVPDWLHRKGKCQPQRNIAFLKTHKCASSSIQNILLRYGWSRDLNFVVPVMNNYLVKEGPFKSSMAEDLPWHGLGYNIYACHAKWNYQQVSRIMPEDTRYITIVRDPNNLFESLFMYYKFEKWHNTTLKKFILHRNSRTRYEGYYGMNQMAFDMGFDLKHPNQQKVLSLDTQWDLVMVMERMEESLVLLAHILCWPLQDVLMLKINARTEQHHESLRWELKQMLRSKQKLDYFIYNHYQKKFNSLVEYFGKDRMEKEVQELRRLTSALVQRCGLVKQEAANITGEAKPYSDIVSGFQSLSNDSSCSLYTLPEMTFLDLIRDRALHKAKEQLGEQLVDQKLGTAKEQYKDRQLQRERNAQRKRRGHQRRSADGQHQQQPIESMTQQVDQLSEERRQILRGFIQS